VNAKIDRVLEDIRRRCEENKKAYREDISIRAAAAAAQNRVEKIMAEQRKMRG
jgi:hypothetical protein